MKEAWDLVTRWEISEPTRHRPPIPEVLVLSMCVVAWQLNWYSWVGSTLIAFYGAGRIGEVLRCARGNLLLPSDACGELAHTAFLKLRRVQSLGRQPSKIQHMKTQDSDAVRMLEMLYKDVPSDAMLYAASPGVYRKRWDHLLKILDVELAHVRLTPGGLRGRSAVKRYRSGMQIPQLLWGMRLRQQSTLEGYLQETKAIGILRDLPHDVRVRLSSLKSMFRFLRYGSSGAT
eukprot:s533_g1.t1